MATDAKAAIDAVGALLSAFLKSGPQSPIHHAEIERQVLEIVRANIISSEQSTDAYKRRCDEFLATVIKRGGLPIREIMSADSDVTSRGTTATRRRTAKKSIPRAKLQSNHKSCVDNYRRESTLYLDGELNTLRDILRDFIREVLAGRSKEPATRRKITAIKGAFRDLTNWDRFFSTIKNDSFPASLRRTFDLEGKPIAAIWRYSVLDEQGEFRNAYSHKDRADRVYAVRGNWAIEKGLMKIGASGFIDETIQPGEELDCMCRFQWLFNLGALPEEMRTAKGNAELKRVRHLANQIVDKEEPKFTSAKRRGILRRMMRWVGLDKS